MFPSRAAPELTFLAGRRSGRSSRGGGPWGWLGLGYVCVRMWRARASSGFASSFCRASSMAANGMGLLSWLRLAWLGPRRYGQAARRIWGALGALGCVARGRPVAHLLPARAAAARTRGRPLSRVSAVATGAALSLARSHGARRVLVVGVLVRPMSRWWPMSLWVRACVRVRASAACD